MLGTTLALALLGCIGSDPIYSGNKTYEYFPLDGVRTWTYVPDIDAASPNVDYNLFVEKMGTRNVEGSTVVTLEYRNDSTGDLKYSIDWSSDSAGGIRIWGYAVQGGESVTFDEPVQFADYTMVVGDSTETQTNGKTYTSTLDAKDDCTNYWTDNVWECLYFYLEDGDGDDNAGVPFAGHWAIAGSYGATRFQPTGIAQDWVLATGSWSDGSEAN